MKFLVANLILIFFALPSMAYLQYADRCSTVSHNVSDQTSLGNFCPKHLRFSFKEASAFLNTYKHKEGEAEREGVYFLKNDQGQSISQTPHNQDTNTRFEGVEDRNSCYLEIKSRPRASTSEERAKDHRARHYDSIDFFNEPNLYVHKAPRILMAPVVADEINDQEISYKTTFTMYLGSREEVEKAVAEEHPAGKVQREARYILRCQSQTLYCHKAQCYSAGRPASARINQKNYVEYEELNFSLEELRELLEEWIQVDMDEWAYSRFERKL